MPRDVSLLDSRCWNGGQKWVNSNTGMWVSEVSLLQQPRVRYCDELLLLLHTTRGPRLWSSNPSLREMAPQLLLTPSIKASYYIGIIQRKRGH